MDCLMAILMNLEWLTVRHSGLLILIRQHTIQIITMVITKIVAAMAAIQAIIITTMDGIVMDINSNKAAYNFNIKLEVPKTIVHN